MKINKKIVFVLLVFVMMFSVVSNNALAYYYRSGNYYSSNSYSTNRYSYSTNRYSTRYNYRYSYNNNTTNDNTDSDTTNNINDESNKEVQAPDAGNNINNNQNNTNTTVLKYGDRGSEVKNIQTKLSKLGYQLSVTGFYDRKTILAVYYFQKANGLSRTGRVDNITRNKLEVVYREKLSNPIEEKTPVTEPTPVPEPKPEPKPEPAPSPQPAPDNSSQMEKQMLNLINQERQANGLQPLVMDTRVVNLARKKSQDMIDNNYFSHTSPTYGSPFKMLNDAGVSYRTAGENIAGNHTVSAAHRALMNSSGHRKNILNPNFTKVGIGIIEGGPYGMMFTQIFIG